MTAETPQHILLVEDDQRLATLVAEFLENNGYRVGVESRGDRAPARILEEKPDLVILDLMLPGKDGLAICREVRDRYPGVILMLTARGEDIDEIIGLEIGADDYLAKPTKPRVLLAHIKSQLRRTGRLTDAHQVYGDEGQRRSIGDLHIDASARTVRLGDEPISLTTAEFDLLWFLAARAGEVVSRETIYSELRGIEYDGLDRSIDLRVARLRKKLGDDAKHPKLIKSVRGAGYLMATPAARDEGR